MFKAGLLMLIALTLSACEMTPTQKTWAGVAAGVLIVGAMVAHDADSGKPQSPTVATPGVNCASNPALCQ